MILVLKCYYISYLVTMKTYIHAIFIKKKWAEMEKHNFKIFTFKTGWKPCKHNHIIMMFSKYSAQCHRNIKSKGLKDIKVNGCRNVLMMFTLNVFENIVGILSWYTLKCWENLTETVVETFPKHFSQNVSMIFTYHWMHNVQYVVSAW